MLQSSSGSEYKMELIEEYDGWIIARYHDTYELYCEPRISGEQNSSTTLTHADGRVWHWSSNWFENNGHDDHIYQSGDIEELRETLRKIGVAKITPEFSPF